MGWFEPQPDRLGSVRRQNLGIAAPAYDELRAAESVPFIHSSVARVKK
jgi:hypothetical protein